MEINQLNIILQIIIFGEQYLSIVNTVHLENTESYLLLDLLRVNKLSQDYNNLGMFAKQIDLRTSNRANVLPYFLKEAEYSAVDLQYQICSKFMKVACEKLYQKEMQLIEHTTKFIDRINDNVAQKDISSTQESTNFDTIIDQEDLFAQSRSRLLLRKSHSNTNLRRTQNTLTEALREVSSKCSQKTSKMFISMSTEFRKLKQKLASLEKMQKEAKKIEAKLGTTQQELVVMRKRVSDLQKGSKILQQQATALRKKVKEFNQQSKITKLCLSKSTDHFKASNNPNPTDKLKKYLQQKQLHIFKKEREIKNIQDNIQSLLQGCIVDGCQKCCNLMKRVKDSIIKYRTYLQEQANAGQAFYFKYKNIFC